MSKKYRYQTSAEQEVQAGSQARAELPAAIL
jgi:hypothetical protein